MAGRERLLREAGKIEGGERRERVQGERKKRYTIKMHLTIE